MKPLCKSQNLLVIFIFISKIDIDIILKINLHNPNGRISIHDKVAGND